MPKWGLTPDQRKAKPWDLPAAQLAPAKTITDPIHGDIYITRLEQCLLDSPPLQRLRKVRQLGTTHLVYPGATHTRLSHSLGALRAAQDLLDAVIGQRHAADPVPDLFSQWASDSDSYNKEIAKITVLTRLGALLHDLCHVPYGHSVEDDIGLLRPHDANSERFEVLWEQVDTDTRQFFSKDLMDALRPLILSKEKSPRDDESPHANPYAFVADIVGNTICADLLDYLRRDHLYTGLPASLGHRFIDGFYVTPLDHGYYPARMVMRIVRHGRERADIVSELFKYLRYRYELSERALVHHAKLAADAMIGKLLEMWGDAIWIDLARERYPDIVKDSSEVDAIRSDISSNDDAAVRTIDQLKREKLEGYFLRYGDDGLLEFILDQAESDEANDSRRAAIASLATRIQCRDLFKPIARCSSARAQAQAIHDKYSPPDERRRLEEGAATYAGLDHRWHILLWVPNPLMRLKAAEVLVDKGGYIAPLKDHENVGRHLGSDIYESHKALWAISAFAPKKVRDDRIRRDATLAWIADKLGIEWDDPKPIPSLTELAVQHVGAKNSLSRAAEEELALNVESDLAASGSESRQLETFDHLIAKVEAVLQATARQDESNTFTRESVLSVLEGYLPTSARSRERREIANLLPEFVNKANQLDKEQQQALWKKLSDMKIKDGRRLRAASTRSDTIRSVLAKLLEEVRDKK
jgi:uncharacterized protein